MPDIGPLLPPNEAAGMGAVPGGGTSNTPTQDTGHSTDSTATLGSNPASSPGNGIVWASTTWKIGPFGTGITTRGLKDAAVLAASVIVAILGFILLSEPDIAAAGRKLGRAVPIPV